MIYAKITKNNGGNYVIPLFMLNEYLDDEFDMVEEWAEEGDSLTVEFVLMEDEEFEKLDEFQGW